jgi:hypothetical protein
MYASHAFAVILALSIIGCRRESGLTQTKVGNETSTAPSGNEAAERDKTLVRFANSDPATPTADLYFDASKFFTDVSYKDVTPYKEIPGKLYELQLRAAGKDAKAPATENETFMDGRRYTVVAVPKRNGESALLTVNDDTAPPSSGKAKLRVIHAAPNAGSVDLYPTGHKDSLFSNVDFESSTRYKEVDPIKTTLEIRDDNRKAAKWSGPAMDLQPDKSYTVILTGGRGGAIDFVVIEDETMRAAAER